jgi:DNA-binding response OmpR family regulator
VSAGQGPYIVWIDALGGQKFLHTKSTSGGEAGACLWCSNRGRSMRVLIIDDDPAYLSACATVLRDDGHDVVASSDFNEGRQLLAGEGRFEALVTDVRLGAYNGLHLIVLAAPSVVAKIALSAVVDPVIQREAERLGARFVVKPTKAASVSALLR